MDSLPVKIPTETVTAHQKYLFHHVMKCGGTSIRLIFEKILGSSNVLWAVDRDVDLSPASLSRPTLIGGHFPHLFGSYFHADRSYISMLRSPTDRVLSHYFFYKNNDPVKNIPIKKTQALSLSEFIHSEDPDIILYLSNFQTKIFAYLDPSVCNLGMDELLKKAQEHLGRFAFVGLYEEFCDSVDFCCLRFGFPPVPDIPRENVTKDRRFSHDLSQELLKKLARLNEADVEFYESAKNLFLRQKRSLLLRVIDLNKDSGLIERTTSPLDTSESCEHSRSASHEEGVPNAWGDFDIRFVEVSLSGSRSGSNTIITGEDIILRMFVESVRGVGNVTAGFSVKDSAGATLYGTNSYHLKEEILVEKSKKYCIEFRFRADLGLGDYFVSCALHTGSTHSERCHHWWENAISFSIVDCLEPLFIGPVRLPSSVRANEIFLEDPFRAELQPLKDVEVLGALEESEIPVRVKNTSSAVWLTTGDNPVNLSYHWIDDKGEVVVYDGVRTSLGRPVLPGDELVLSARIHGPAQAGRFLLRLTLVQEWIAWFEQRGVETLDFHVLVEPTAYKAHQPQMTSSE
jgi:hypothetical protein